MKIEEMVNNFLLESKQFQLGQLPTEQPHPLTFDLSIKAQSDLASAIETFQEVELAAFEKILPALPHLETLKKDIRQTLQAGNKIYFCGCGATGRLSVALESLWRESSRAPHPDLLERVQGFIAGGDYALVKSIENFEDHPEFGAKQLMDLGFGKNDLLISTTEGGETPFVIGATLQAAKISNRSPYFLYCNPKESLRDIERSQAIFMDKKIHDVSLEIGQMAICGSTRLQASSVLYMACALPLMSYLTADLDIKSEIESYIQFLDQIDLTPLVDLVRLEAATYQKFDFLTYHTSSNALGILTDLTERSPTFSLRAVENKLDTSVRPATVNLTIDSAANSNEAWEQIIGRAPIALDWSDLDGKYNEDVVLGFDFSRLGLRFRQSLINQQTHHQVYIQEHEHEFEFKSDHFDLRMSRPSGVIPKNLFLKLIFNLASSLAMAMNFRVLGNVMLYVRPSNKKLIDRAARYVQEILKEQHNLNAPYRDVVKCIFYCKENQPGEDSVVLKSVEHYLSQLKSRG